MRKDGYRGRHSAPQDPYARAPWQTHLKKRGTPRLLRKVITLAVILALVALGVYIYLLLNPMVGRHMEIR